MRKISFVFMFIINAFIITTAFSQVDVKLMMRNPAPSEIYQWQQDPSIIQLIVTNLTTNEYQNACLVFKITNEDGNVIAENKLNNRSSARFNILPMPQVTILNGSQIIDVNSISYNINIKSLVITGITIPEGFYEICVSVYDQYGNNITSGDEYCTNFTVLIPEPPVIISPTENEVLTSPFPTFIWTPVTSYNTVTNPVKYKFKICPIYHGQSLRMAIDNNQPLHEESDILTTSYLYLPSNLPFTYYQNIDGYVWMVQALDMNGNAAASNDGKSELGTFRIEDTEEPILLSNIYPVDNDTIPWITPHMVAQFSPYSDDITSINYTLHLKKEGATNDFAHSRVLNFAGGSQISQQLGSANEASIIICNVDDAKLFPQWMRNLEPGVKYLWNVDAEFTKADGSKQSTSSSVSSFIIGFKKPAKMYPSKDTLIQAKAEFNFVFQIPQPQVLNFEQHSLLNNSMFHAYSSSSEAFGKFSIEIAKKETFDSIVQTKTVEIPSGEKYKTGSGCNELYATINKKMDGIKDTGQYYYHINYLNNADIKYFTSPARKIKVVPDSAVTCFEMIVQRPYNNGTWTESLEPKFSVSIRPEIKKSAITGGRIKVWKKLTNSQTNENIKTGKTVLDTTFTGNGDSLIYAFSTDLDGYTRYDLNFVNGGTKSKIFKAAKDSTYLWNFTLNFNKDSIRSDKQFCASNSVISNDGIFKVLPDTSVQGSCPGECYANLPDDKTPGTQSIAKDSTIKVGKFKIKLTTVSGTPSNLSGEGTVEVKYLRAPIKVEFNGLKVNSQSEVYEGDAYAVVDANAPYAQPAKDDYEGKALAWAHDKMKFQEIHEFSASSERLVSGFIGSTPVALPLGFDKDVEGFPVIIAIVGMRFTPIKATLNASMYVEFPSLGPDIGFGLGGTDMCFHEDGLSDDGRKMLYLAQDFGYDSEDSWSFLFKAPTPSDSGTYALWDCKSFRELVISAEVEFPRSWLKPSPDPDPSVKAKARFKAHADKNGNGWYWMGHATMQECELSAAEGYKMAIQEMVLDLSPVRNPDGIIFPKNYSEDKTVKWEGFYIKKASISFPDDIKTFDNESPVLSFNNNIITKSGFTGGIWGENVIQYPKTNFGDWGASIDTIKMEFINSSLYSGYLKGRIKVSIIDSALLYSALVYNITGNEDLKYQFTITPKDTATVDMSKAKLVLDPTSKIELSNKNNKFIAEAKLDGKLTLENKIGNIPGIDFKGLQFEGLKVSSEPSFDKGNWSLASPQHGMAGFPVSINNIDLVTGIRSGSFAAGLQFNLNVSFQSGSEAFSGTTKLSIWGKMDSDTQGQNFSFDGVELDSIGINADLGAVKISGGLDLYGSHTTFGNGFRGAVNATFIDQMTLMATAQFGSVNNYRYWYVDAKALFSEGIPVFSGVGMYGFGGGAWYHMRKTGVTDLSVPANSPDTSSIAGKTNSGYSYVPDKNVDLGLNATLVLGTHPSPEAFNSDVGMEAQFLSNGGIGTIALVGDGYMLCDITKRQSAKILADVDMEYNFPTQIFHGVFDVDIKANPFTGGGQMVMHFAPNEWYVKIGEPSNRMNISLADWLGADAYFMMGQNLPTPVLPSEIQTLYPNFQTYRNPAITTGDGIVFGASAGFDTGRQTYSIFYGDFSALIGFDMALLNYGTGTTCEGISGPIGINGWYATGQIYSHLAASIGLHVDIGFTEGNYEILNINGGSLLQGAGPNPTWVKGVVGGNYRILSGAVKGYCCFEFSKGDQCQMMVENPLTRVDLISDINPVSGTTNVDVFTEPQVAMNFELNTPFELLEMPTGNGAQILRTFRIKLKDFNMKKVSNNDSVPGRMNISSDKFSAYYTSHNMLSGNTNYKFSVSAYGEEYKIGQWNPAVKNNGSVISQIETTTFKTGSAPSTIVQSNVAYSYPMHTQKYFLQDECRIGRVQLKFGQDNLFGVLPDHRLELIARFVSYNNNIQPVEVPFTYNSASKAILFDIPNLMNSSLYYVQFVKKQVPQNAEKPGNTSESNEKDNNTRVASSVRSNENMAHSSDSSNVFITSRSILQARTRSGEKILYSMHFSNSRFNTLQYKLSSFQNTSTSYTNYSTEYEVMEAKYIGSEYFGYFDFHTVNWTMSGATHTFGPLVKIYGHERNSTWHNSFVNPKVYDNIQWMKSKGWWNAIVNFDQCINSTTCSFVDIDYNSLNPLASSSVISALAGGGSSSSTGYATGAVSSGNSAITGFSPSSMGGITLSGLQSSMLSNETPNLIVTYNHGIIVPPDFNRLKSKAIGVLSNPFIYKTSSEKSKLTQIFMMNYQLMNHGNYPLKFFYNYRGCLGPDDNAPTINKPFVY